MIFFLLAVLCLTDAAVRPRHNTDDEMEGTFYEIPEYEDPELAMFKLLSRGAMPVFTLMQAPKVSDDFSKVKDDARSSVLDDINKDVGDLEIRLQIAKSRLGNGESQIFEDIEKLIHYLMNLKNHIDRNVYPMYASYDQSTTTDVSAKKTMDSDISKDQSFAADHSKLLTSDASISLYSGDNPKKDITSIISEGRHFVSTKPIALYLQSNITVERPLSFDNSSKKSIASDTTLPSHLLFDSSKKSSSPDVSTNQYLTSNEHSEQLSHSTESLKKPASSKAFNNQSSATNTSVSLLSSVSDKKILTSKDTLSDITKYHYFVPDMFEPFAFVEEYLASKDSSKKPVASDVSKDQEFASDVSVHPYLVIDTFAVQSTPSDGSAEISVTSDTSENVSSTPHISVIPYLKSEVTSDRVSTFDYFTKSDDSAQSSFATYEFEDNDSTAEDSGETQHLTSDDDFKHKYSASDASTEHSLTSEGKKRILKSEVEIFYSQPLFSKHNTEVEDIRPEGKMKTSFRDEVHIPEVNKPENKEKDSAGKWTWKASKSA